MASFGDPHRFGRPADESQGRRSRNSALDLGPSVRARELFEYGKRALRLPGKGHYGRFGRHEAIHPRLRGDDLAGSRDDGERHFRFAEAPLGVLGASGNKPERDLLIASKLLAVAKDAFRTIEGTELVECLAQQQRSIRIQVGTWYGFHQAPYNPEVMRVAREAGAAD